MQLIFSAITVFAVTLNLPQRLLQRLNAVFLFIDQLGLRRDKVDRVLASPDLCAVRENAVLHINAGCKDGHIISPLLAVLAKASNGLGHYPTAGHKRE